MLAGLLLGWLLQVIFCHNWSKWFLGIPVFPIDGAGIYILCDRFDHKSLRLLNSNFVQRIKIPKYFKTSPVAVSLILFFLNAIFVSKVHYVSCERGNVIKKSNLGSRLPESESLTRTSPVIVWSPHVFLVNRAVLIPFSLRIIGHPPNPITINILLVLRLRVRFLGGSIILSTSSASTSSKFSSFLVVKIKSGAFSAWETSETTSRFGDAVGGCMNEGDNTGQGASLQDRRFTLEMFEMSLPRSNLAWTFIRKWPDGSLSLDMLKTTPIKILVLDAEPYLRLHTDTHVIWEAFSITLAPNLLHPFFLLGTVSAFFFFSTFFYKKLNPHAESSCQPTWYTLKQEHVENNWQISILRST